MPTHQTNLYYTTAHRAHPTSRKSHRKRMIEQGEIGGGGGKMNTAADWLAFSTRNDRFFNAVRAQAFPRWHPITKAARQRAGSRFHLRVSENTANNTTG